MNHLKIFESEAFLSLDEIFQEFVSNSFKTCLDFPKMKTLEMEWARFKYLVLEYSHVHYLRIRQLLKDKESFPCESFYLLILEALSKEVDQKSKINSMEHVWGYFKNRANTMEKRTMRELVQGFENNEITVLQIKDFLYHLSIKYQMKFLLDSYYFVDIIAIKKSS